MKILTTQSRYYSLTISSIFPTFLIATTVNTHFYRRCPTFPNCSVPLFQSEASYKTFHMEMSSICMWMKPHFHIEGYAPRLALKHRYKATRKWPISAFFSSVGLTLSIHWEGGTGAGDREKRGWEGTVRERRGGEKRDSQGGGKREKKGKITQRCAIFCNRKNSKRREPTNTEREPGLQEAGSLNLPVPPPPPPPTIQTRSQVLDALISPYGKDLMGLHSLKELDSRLSLFLFSVSVNNHGSVIFND